MTIEVLLNTLPDQSAELVSYDSALGAALVASMDALVSPDYLSESDWAQPSRVGRPRWSSRRLRVFAPECRYRRSETS